jgi:hypothetical protein
MAQHHADHFPSFMVVVPAVARETDQRIPVIYRFIFESMDRAEGDNKAVFANIGAFGKIPRAGFFPGY